ncbi:MAG: alpha-amylase family glycosyl hydrolase [Steroidobacteraceae bacterium]
MADILARRSTAFVLWHISVTATDAAPQVIIGWLQPGTPPTLVGQRTLPMQAVPEFPDLWLLNATDCDLTDGWTYYYWFEVPLHQPDRPPGRLWITDPLATTVDWRVRAPRLDAPFTDDDFYPAATVLYRGGQLLAADVGGEIAAATGGASLDALAPNNQLVIYELPTAWTRSAQFGGRDVGVGSFRDVLALIDANVAGANFGDLEVTRRGRSYLVQELGINALELLPPADSIYNRDWGYGTTNYLAPDFELGLPETYSWAAPNRDLTQLVGACHAHGTRFLADMVMAFTKNNPYLANASDAFFILHPEQTPDDPDAHTSRGTGTANLRNGFGASLFRYASFTSGYDPISGQLRSINPARQFMLTMLERWMQDFDIDGVRMDSVENISNWDFVQQFKDHARALNRDRFAARGSSGAEERFLVVGEELSEPQALLQQHRLDGLWHQSFKDYIRMALIGLNHENEPTFESTVRRAIDCRSFGYQDLAQAVIYLTSHDVEGPRNERLFNFLQRAGVADIEKRTKLAFACLLTAVGIPMILAGDEFADQHDLLDVSGNVVQTGGKQVDPVNFSRLEDDWRARIKDYVARLIKLRTTAAALCVNDVEFLHTDFAEGKRVMVWRRGEPGAVSQVIVLANFSDFASAAGFGYVVPNWPTLPVGSHWREVSQSRDVPDEDAGREPIFAWEAKVYATV